MAEVASALRRDLGAAAVTAVLQRMDTSRPRVCLACGAQIHPHQPTVLQVGRLLPAVAATALCHRTCRASRWVEASAVADWHETTWEAAAGVVQVQGPDWDHLLAGPMIILNPSLEQVWLRRDDSGVWQLAPALLPLQLMSGADPAAPQPLGGRVRITGTPRSPASAGEAVFDIDVGPSTYPHLWTTYRCPAHIEVVKEAWRHQEVTVAATTAWPPDILSAPDTAVVSLPLHTP